MSGIKAQAQAVELAFLNVRAHRDVVANLVARRKRPAHDLTILDLQLANLGPAVKTMKWLELNEESIREALERA